MPTSDSDLLARAIQASGLSTRQFAKQVLIRDPGTVRRWLAGTLEIPTIVREHLERLEKQRLETEEGDRKVNQEIEKLVLSLRSQLGRGD